MDIVADPAARHMLSVCAYNLMAVAGTFREGGQGAVGLALFAKSTEPLLR
jgi:hypothetical protein